MKISRKLFILFFVGWMVFVTICSLLPNGVALAEMLVPWDKLDKVGHFTAYFFTALLFFFSFRTRFKWADIYAVLFASGYGAIMEVAQLFVPGRVGCLQDVAINLSGALFFFALYRILWGKI
jgi:VanZ family protein